MSPWEEHLYQYPQLILSVLGRIELRCGLHFPFFHIHRNVEPVAVDPLFLKKEILVLKRGREERTGCNVWGFFEDGPGPPRLMLRFKKGPKFKLKKDGFSVSTWFYTISMPFDTVIAFEHYGAMTADLGISSQLGGFQRTEYVVTLSLTGEQSGAVKHFNLSF